MAVYEQEGASTDFPVCRGFWFFWPQKNIAERQKSEYKVIVLRVKTTEEYSRSAVKGENLCCCSCRTTFCAQTKKCAVFHNRAHSLFPTGNNGLENSIPQIYISKIAFCKFFCIFFSNDVLKCGKSSLSRVYVNVELENRYRDSHRGT